MNDMDSLYMSMSKACRLFAHAHGHVHVQQENTVNELLQEKEELAAQRDSQLVHISEMRAQIASCLVKLQSTETDRASTTQEIRSLRESISSKKAEQAHVHSA
jgi:peptidoglycan hydrolase CwlO-like protein